MQGYTSAVRWFAADHLLRQADKTSWEQQLKARAQYGQNDYTRMGGTQP